MHAIEISKLKKVYSNGTEALQEVDLLVEAGDFFALLGANGAGKTTLIGILTGLVTKTSGSSSIFGIDIDKNPLEAKTMMGVVPQEMNFNLFEKAQDIVIQQAGYFGIDYKTAKRNSEEILKRLNLWDKRDIQSRMLSGGMKRRLMIARALINKPRLLILDEPTAGVDVELRQSMWEFIREINKEGTTILLTTHYLEEVEQLCRKAAMIKDGKVVTQGSVKDLLNCVTKETYVIHVEKVFALEALKLYKPVKIDDETFEVDIDKTDTLNSFIENMPQTGMVLKDIRPKGNRIEKLFLNILRGNQ